MTGVAFVVQVHLQSQNGLISTLLTYDPDLPIQSYKNKVIYSLWSHLQGSHVLENLDDPEI